MITIGITGGYATGKTLVADMFKELGAKVVDVDCIARVSLRPRTLLWQKAVGYFGKGILRKDGLINRKKLAGVIFADTIKRKKLNQLIHPSIINEIKRIIKNTAEKGKIRVLAVDAPLLFEAGIEGLFDKIIVVNCSEEAQYNRAKSRNKLSREQVLQRAKSQWPLARKIRKADFIVDNSGSSVKTRKQVNKIWRELFSLLCADGLG